MKRFGFFRTDFLFPRNSFFIGLGSIMGIAGNYFEFNSSNSEIEADRKAMLSDWGVVGKDMESASESMKLNADGNRG